MSQTYDKQDQKNFLHLEDWVLKSLADTVTKKHAQPESFKRVNGVIDARVFLRNTYGFHDWEVGQQKYEEWESSGQGYMDQISTYKKEIEYDRPIYEHYKLSGDILDVGGLTGTVREFLDTDHRFVSIDPYLEAVFKIPPAKREAYKCLSKPLNFIGGLAEFLPFQAEIFDYVHMRSMLDHVQVPDLALKEANRVLKTNGKLLVGLHVEGGKTGRKTFIRLAKDIVKKALERMGIDKYKDFHTWHPTYKNLLKLITENGFDVNDCYWQPYWKDQVVYVLATKQV
jgi:ubiquinone/menaquinone biosynthesis C-methylase UbiE